MFVKHLCPVYYYLLNFRFQIAKSFVQRTKSYAERIGPQYPHVRRKRQLKWDIFPE